MMLYFIFTLCGIIISSANEQSGSACLTPNGEHAQCVSIDNCKKPAGDKIDTSKAVNIDNIIFYIFGTLPPPPMDLRFLRFMGSSQCSSSDIPLVCCVTEDDADQIVTQTTTRRPQDTQTFIRNPLLPDRSYCGFQEDGDCCIVSGIETDFLEFPWMALLKYRNIDGSYKFSCGGVLINERYVLTAAHCVKGAINQTVGTLLAVRLGEFDTGSDIDCLPRENRVCNHKHIDFEVEEVLVHEDFDDNSTSRYHDIALIRLAENVQLNEQIKPICLPTSSSERSETGSIAYAAGWGRTESVNYSARKLKTKLQIVANSDCTRTFIIAEVKVADTQMCAGGQERQDSCIGDSGGPLMVTAKNDTGQWIAEGVASFDTTCEPKYLPGIYTRISEYLPWIHENVRA